MKRTKMRILMLGWEFPPYITGGLGQACYGLTRALDSMGHEITFVLPRPIDHGKGQAPTHLALRAPAGLAADAPREVSLNPAFASARPGQPAAMESRGLVRTRFVQVPASFSHPYPAFEPATPRTVLESVSPEAMVRRAGAGNLGVDGAVSATPFEASDQSKGVPAAAYGDDLVADADRYALLAVALTRGEQYDVIHAHDWLTFPAGIMLSTISGKPLVVHLHSTEFDRAGNNANRRIVEVERAGMAAADRVFAVSQLTKTIIVRRYGIAPNKIDVVYNGIDAQTPLLPRPEREGQSDRIVLFLGRITWQKGPEYFINAAKRVLEVAPNTRFVLAGAGDMALRMMDLANSLGIGKRVHFTGFLNGPDVARIMDMADVYVMPSVSEPFGIAALEALSHQVPVIISRTSGAGEVLEHVLKVDFWDVDDLANKIVAVISNPALASTLRQNSMAELHRLNWTTAAERCLAGYAAITSGRV
jgi:glycogen(starch) synthase